MINTDDILQVLRDAISSLSRIFNTVRANTEVSATLFRGSLPTASTTPVYTVRPQARITLREFVICNTTAGAVSYSIAITDPGVAESAPYRLYDTVLLGANSTDNLSHRIHMNPEERLYIWASGAGLTARVSGLEVTAL